MHKNQKGLFENKESEEYLNLVKYKDYNRINKKIIKNINKIKGQKYIILIKLVILLNLFIRTFQIHKINFIYFYFNNITLKVKGPGNKKIFCGNSNQFSTNHYPNSIFINQKKKDSVNYFFDLNKSLNIVKLVWNNKLNQMKDMFRDCPDILEIDFSEFDASEVSHMNGIFYGCTSLASVNFDNINSSQFIYLGGMFINCSSLTSVNLTNFVNSKPKTLRNMFVGCSSLTSLELPNFDNTNVEYINNMFDGCIKLQYINMNNFSETNISKEEDIIDIFKGVPENIVVCINEENNKNIIIPQLKNKKCYNIDCSDDWKSKQKNIISSVNGCECELNGCLSCDNLNLNENKRICKVCKDNFYRIENTPLINEIYSECYKEPKGYYLDIYDKLYKKCFDTCEKCKMKGDNKTHNCLTCNDNFPNGINYNNSLNCYINCSFYYYFDNEHTYYCTINPYCPNEYSKLLADKRKCIEDYNIIINDIINNKQENEKEEIKYYDKILETVEDIFTSNDFDTSEIDKGEDQIINTEKMKITLTTTRNQKDNINNNMTNIDLGDCETSLKQSYNLTNNETIYIKMLEVSQEEMRIPKVEYDIYAKLNGENLTKLDLNSCKNSKISLLIPVNNVGNLDKLNTSSGYYNDFCYTTTSDSGTDISLKDRKNEYPSKTVCENDCDFVDYNYTTKKAKCSCEYKKSSSSFAHMKIDKKKLLDNLKDIKNIANLNLLKCFKVLFNITGILKNVGFYIFIVIILFHTITLFIFYIKELNLLINKIKLLIFVLNNFKLKKEINKEENNKVIIEKCPKEKEIKNFKIKLNMVNNNNKINNYIININNEINKDDKKLKLKENAKKVLKTKKIKVSKKLIQFYINNNDNMINNDLNSNNIIISEKKEYERNIILEKYSKLNEIKKLELIKDYTDDEINDLSYDLALQNDKRSYWQYYISLIKTKHEFVFSFFL